jgi:hypothetical protein
MNKTAFPRRLSLPHFWIGLIVVADLAIGVQLSVLVAILVLWSLPILYRAAWWHPLIPAGAFLVAAPAAIATGVGNGLDAYAVVALALAALSLFLLAARERRRLRSADG